MEKTYQGLPRPLDPERFLQEALRALQIDVLIHGEEISIPSKGSLLVVANHPFGGLEGLVAASVLLSVRKDLKIMANQFLGKIPEISPLIVGVNPFERLGSRYENVRPTLQCLKWLKGGGALLVFPSGTVSHFQMRKRGITDPPWSSSVGRLVLWSRSSVLPIYFEGANSFWFHFLGLFHPLLRTLLLPRELHNKRGRQVQMTIGPVFSFEELCQMESADVITEYLRARTYALGLQRERNGRKKMLQRFPLDAAKRRINRMEPLRASVPAADLEKDVAHLPPNHCLGSGGSYRIYWAGASLIPNVLREIGRLREIAFRAAGEGTGRSEDLDRFDRHYDHLFLWKSDTREVVGAYRIGRVDVILSRMGMSGLYTASLFRYEQGLRPLLVQSLELGRSFVRPEYQKNYTPLWFLWKGIGRYAAMHGTYRYLFGPVSISNAYHVFSRYLLYMYLNP
ncbi:MAG: lysophospholipid acyltransferase family protein [Desulfosoma sp.]